MLLEMNVEERKVVEDMRRVAGLLEGIEGHLIPESENVVYVFCGDGHHSLNAVQHYHRHVANGRDDIMYHLIAMNGGATRLAQPEGEIFLTDIGGAMRIKNARTVLMEAHVPCGAMRETNVGVLGALRALTVAKDMVQKRYPRAEVILFFRVYYGLDEGGVPRRRTYYINGKKLLSYLDENQPVAEDWDEALKT